MLKAPIPCAWSPLDHVPVEPAGIVSSDLLYELVVVEVLHERSRRTWEGAVEVRVIRREQHDVFPHRPYQLRKPWFVGLAAEVAVATEDKGTRCALQRPPASAVAVNGLSGLVEPVRVLPDPSDPDSRNATRSRWNRSMTPPMTRSPMAIIWPKGWAMA